MQVERDRRPNGRVLVRRRLIAAKIAGFFNAMSILWLVALGCALATASLIGDFRFLTSRTWGDVARESFLAISALVTGALAALGFWTVGKRLFAAPRLVLYFRDKPGAEIRDEFSLKGGFAIARAIGELDDAAVSANVRPLSDYGFAGHRRKPVWHDASEGPRTVEALIASDSFKSEVLTAHLRDDLEGMRHLLQAGAAIGTAFTLIVWSVGFRARSSGGPSHPPKLTHHEVFQRAGICLKSC